MILVTLENHVYKFNNEVRKQKEGGPIGLALTGEIADCFMVNWDKLFLKKLESLGIIPAIYERFKDDITMALISLEKGLIYKDGKLTIDKEKQIEDETRSEEAVTMQIIREIAQSIDPMIKFTVDSPMNHENGKIPILDIQASINVNEQNRIDFEYYEKPTKNKFVILQSSALSSKQKRTILTQECLRIYRNTKIELGKGVQIKHLNNFMVKVKNSGYGVKFRKEILNSASQAFEKMIQDDKNGIKPLFRGKDWKIEERKAGKESKRVNWYKGYKTSDGIEYTSVLFVPVTKGGALAKELRIREAELNKYSTERIKIIEDGGIKLKDFLVQKNPFPNQKCTKKKCVICESEVAENPKITCNSNNVGYRLGCETCLIRGKVKVYEGETARSARLRGQEHFSDLKHKRSKSVLFKHKQIEHKNEDMKITMQITQKFHDPLTRQANEAVRISQRENYQLMNSKTEFNHPPIARIVVEKNGKIRNN